MTMSDWSWPAAQLGEALDALARHSGLAGRAEAVPAPRAATERLSPWIEAAASWLGCEAEPVQTPYGEVEDLVTNGGPALLRLPGPGTPRFVVLLASRRGRVALLTPGRLVVRRPAREIRDALCRAVEAPREGEVDQLLAATGLRGRRRQQVRQALLRQLLVNARVGDGWLLRPTGAADLASQARETRLPRVLVTLLGAHLGAYALWVLSWWLLGSLLLRGRLEPGWLAAWGLLLLTLIPFRLITTAAGGRLSIYGGAVLKRRLLAGALQLEPDDVRQLGVGQLLGRVVEAAVVETMALAGGFLALTAVLELGMAALVLGAASSLHVGLLLGTVLATGLLALAYRRRRQRWTTERLELTDDLVERMVGHRTRLAQQPRARWNEGEDQALEGYLAVSAPLDRLGVALQVLVPRGWFLVALLGLAPAFVAGRSTPQLAVTVGGIVLAYQALRRLGDGLDRLTAAWIAWERIRLIWQAAQRRQPVGPPHFALAPAAPTRSGHRQPERALLVAQDLVFRYRDLGEPVLQGAAVRVHAGDRLLLEGPSGGGKSTLAALLAGGRVPESGLLLLHGLDRETLGADGWRRRVVLAPQFHDNHVLMGTFAFNVLLGRGWPPRPADLEEAERVCRALDLGPLLDRMPAGMQQLVGETGWQLSHGEKSRLYLARALLQDGDLLLLDESFAALDPQTLQRSLALVLAKAPTVLVIAHP
jgi:ATP-binding cassette subfamily B protein